MVARDLGWGGNRREVILGLLLVMDTFCLLTVPNSQLPDLWYYSTVLQDVIFGENWVKITQDLYVLFLTIICEHTIIAKQLTKKKRKSTSDHTPCGSSEWITLAVTCQWPWPKGWRNLLYFTTSRHFLASWIHLFSSPGGHCLHLTQYVKAFQLLKPNCQIFFSCWGNSLWLNG